MTSLDERFGYHCDGCHRLFFYKWLYRHYKYFCSLDCFKRWGKTDRLHPKPRGYLLWQRNGHQGTDSNNEAKTSWWTSTIFALTWHDVCYGLVPIHSVFPSNWRNATNASRFLTGNTRHYGRCPKFTHTYCRFCSKRIKRKFAFRAEEHSYCSREHYLAHVRVKLDRWQRTAKACDILASIS